MKLILIYFDFLESAQAAKETDAVNKLLRELVGVGVRAWQQAVYSKNIPVLDNVWECLEGKPRAHELRREMLFAKDRANMNGLQMAVKLGR